MFFGSRVPLPSPPQRPEEFLTDTPESNAVDVSSAISATAGAVLEVSHPPPRYFHGHSCKHILEKAMLRAAGRRRVMLLARSVDLASRLLTGSRQPFARHAGGLESQAAAVPAGAQDHYRGATWLHVDMQPVLRPRRMRRGAIARLQSNLQPGVPGGFLAALLRCCGEGESGSSMPGVPVRCGRASARASTASTDRCVETLPQRDLRGSFRQCVSSNCWSEA